jgi:hypothetical protein
MAWKQILLTGDAAVLSDTPPVNLDFGAAAQGVATEASRQDHKHDLTDATTGDIVPVDGTAEAVGTTSTVARGDHRHGLGPLVADLDFNQNNALSFVLEVVATPPDAGTEVEGQLYYDTDTDHPYVWTP